MNVVLALLWFLLGAKLCLNLSLPFRLARRAPDRSNEGVSMAMVVEAALIVCLPIAAALSTGENWWNHWHFTLAAASGATALCYAMLILILRRRTK